MTEENVTEEIVHASCVAIGERALLIQGASGAGKSALALQLMAYGAGLVADDRTRISATGMGLRASSPPAIAGMIEARGIGLLAAAPLAESRIVAVVDLDRAETERLPEARTTRLLGREIPLILRGDGLSFAAGLLQYLKCGRRM